MLAGIDGSEEAPTIHEIKNVGFRNFALTQFNIPATQDWMKNKKEGDSNVLQQWLR